MSREKLFSKQRNERDAAWPKEEPVHFGFTSGLGDGSMNSLTLHNREFFNIFIDFSENDLWILMKSADLVNLVNLSSNPVEQMDFLTSRSQTTLKLKCRPPVVSHFG